MPTIPTRPLLAVAAAVLAVGVLAGCSSADVKQATDLASSAASSVASGVKGLTGGAIQQGMANVAGGIDGALSKALQGANITSNGKLPHDFPTSAVPIANGTVLGGGAGPDDTGWVAQVRVGSLDAFGTATSELTGAGFTSGTTHSDNSSAFGVFTSSDYRVILTMSKSGDGATATYIVTKK